MATARIKLISSLIEPLKKRVDELIKGECPVAICTSHRARGVEDKKNCEARLLGQLIRDLYTHKLWPLPSAEGVQHTPSDLAKLIAKMAIVPKRAHGSGDQLHWSCRAVSMPAGLREGDPNHLLDYSFALRDEEVQHMKRQAKLAGTEGVIPGSALFGHRVLWPC